MTFGYNKPTLELASRLVPIYFRRIYEIHLLNQTNNPYPYPFGAKRDFYGLFDPKRYKLHCECDIHGM